MPGNYKRISTRNAWSQQDMEDAIEAVKDNRMGWLLASKQFNVPQATLRRHYYDTPVNLGRFKPTFNPVMEKALVDYILEFESRLFGFNTTEIREIAFELAERLGLDHRFDKTKKIAGWDWLKGFRNRNPNISLRAPEPTSAARARAFNKCQVSKFFSLLEKELTDGGILPHRIYNMDESGLNTVQKPPKVFASKGKKQVGAVTSAERGEHFTVVACANAIGNFVPPALIIPRKNHKAEYFDGAPLGTLELCYTTGYMVGDLFFKWMRHFVASTNASVTNKALLILDGHSSHKNIEALEFAKANGVIMLCLPPHCTHRMQPTDISFFGPLQIYYDREMSTWMKNHPGRTVGLYQVAQIFGRAYENAASVRNITSGFTKAGIYPFNPHIFPEEMYLPCEVTENELNDDVEPARDEAVRETIICEKPSSSTEQNLSGHSLLQTEILCILKNISPLPKAASTGKSRVKRKFGGSQVFTSSPFMNDIKAAVQQKKEKENRKSLKQQKQTKRVIFENDEAAPKKSKGKRGDDDVGLEKGDDPGPSSERSTHHRKQTKRVILDYDEDLDVPYANKDVEDDDPACIYCNEIFSKSRPKEHWVKCQLCSKWCHTLCAGIPARKKSFICELCSYD